MTDVVPAGESPQLTSAIRASNVLTREQKSALARTLDGFVDYLAAESSSPQVGDVISEHAWHNRANWEDDAWEIWETWGWFRHWGRTVSELYSAVALYTQRFSHIMPGFTAIFTSTLHSLLMHLLDRGRPVFALPPYACGDPWCSRGLQDPYQQCQSS